jgi:hypothetical protein
LLSNEELLADAEDLGVDLFRSELILNDVSIQSFKSGDCLGVDVKLPGSNFENVSHLFHRVEMFLHHILLRFCILLRLDRLRGHWRLHSCLGFSG